ncbi:hypothetical protein PoB_007288400 [Plakobranchus ocellatus]|uniref:Uncharacterized protein n=1 Tax=Plakobranchus ocellatus TaxID=259542 RepID=A0AAV4DQU6_9GAST|nr:hypothetical protein PoB_007288400 [Plakobranchus ocellatus]
MALQERRCRKAKPVFMEPVDQSMNIIQRKHPIRACARHTCIRISSSVSVLYELVPVTLVSEYHPAHWEYLDPACDALWSQTNDKRTGPLFPPASGQTLDSLESPPQ